MYILKMTNWNNPFFSKFKTLLSKFKTLLSKFKTLLSKFKTFTKFRIKLPFFTSTFLCFYLLLSTGLHAHPTIPPQSHSKSQSQPESQSKPESESQHQQVDKLEPVEATLTENKTLKDRKTPEAPKSQKNPWLFLHGYEAKYKVQSEGETLGHTTRKLSLKDNRWTLATYAKISKYFVSVRNTETTEFHLKDDLLVNDRFYSKTKITFKKAREMQQIFDWENKLETGNRDDKNWQISLEKQVFDRVSHIIQLRSDLLAGKQLFDYDVSYKGKLHIYSYIEEKKEVLQTKMGALASIKLVRTKANGDIFILWLCPELNYLPIKIAQYEQDKADVTLVLESVKYQSDNAS